MHDVWANLDPVFKFIGFTRFGRARAFEHRPKWHEQSGQWVVTTPQGRTQDLGLIGASVAHDQVPALLTRQDTFVIPVPTVIADMTAAANDLDPSPKEVPADTPDPLLSQVDTTPSRGHVAVSVDDDEPATARIPKPSEAQTKGTTTLVKRKADLASMATAAEMLSPSASQPNPWPLVAALIRRLGDKTCAIYTDPAFKADLRTLEDVIEKLSP